MKIAYLSTFYPFRGGIAQFNASLFRALEKEHELKAFTFRRQYPHFLFPGKTQYVGEGDTPDTIPSIPLLDTINPFTYYKTAQVINRFAPDVLLMKYWTSFLAPSLGAVAKQINQRTKIVAILGNVLSHEKTFTDKLFTRYFLNQNDGFVAMSQAVKKQLLALHPRKKKVMVHEHPIYNHFGDTQPVAEARKKIGVDEKKKTILFFGFIREYKGLDLLIQAFNELDDTYQLLIVGECYGSFAPYQQRIDNSPLKHVIHVHNRYICDDQVALYFSASDVCVLPYKSATQSGVTAIAFHFLVPVIATDAGGLDEAVIHEKNGIIVKKNESAAIKNAIKNYFDKDCKQHYVNYIREKNHKKSWNHMSTKIVDFIDTL